MIGSYRQLGCLGVVAGEDRGNGFLRRRMHGGRVTEPRRTGIRTPGGLGGTVVPRVGATAAVLLIAAGLSHWRSFPEILRWDFRAEPRLSALTAARNELQELMRDPRVVLVGCGAWVPRDLEYLLPASGNFKDCLLLRPEEMKGKRIIFVRNEFYNLERSEELDAFLQSCDRQTLFRRKPFVISECPALPK